MITNEIAEDIIAELGSSLPHVDLTLEALVRFDHGRRTGIAQIVSESLGRVLPNVDASEHAQAVTDVLRWYAEGIDLDYVEKESDA